MSVLHRKPTQDSKLTSKVRVVKLDVSGASLVEQVKLVPICLGQVRKVLLVRGVCTLVKGVAGSVT